MLIVQKHLQAVTKALTGKEVASIGELLGKIEQLQAENERFRKTLEKLARLGNEPHLGNSDGNVIAQQALKP